MRNVLKTPGKEQVKCQRPKPILLDTGEMKEPYDWAVSCPLIFSSSIFKHSVFNLIKLLGYNYMMS